MSDSAPADQPPDGDEPDEQYMTHASLFGRLRGKDPAVQQMAWDEFRRRYAPMIAGFSTKCGARRQDVDDIIQEVMTSFWAAKEFTYDPTKGKFRAWLKTCTVRVAIRLKGKAMKISGVPLADIPHVEVAVEPMWNDVWEEQLVSIALEELRRVHGNTIAFKAFEQVALFERSPKEVAEELDTSVDNVHQAKSRMTANLRRMLRHIRELDG